MNGHVQCQSIWKEAFSRLSPHPSGPRALLTGSPDHLQGLTREDPHQGHIKADPHQGLIKANPCQGLTKTDPYQGLIKALPHQGLTKAGQK